MKKFISAFLILIICITVYAPISAQAASFKPNFDVNAESVYMVNLDTGTVVYEKNADEKRPPASLTKLMTALLLMENVKDLDGTKVTAAGYIFDELFGTGSSHADVRPWEEVSARSLLYGMLLPSGNECASIAGDYMANGNLESFFYIMNARAKQLGCTGTNFTSAHGLWGLEKNHYTTAKDMYLIAKACYDTPGFMDVCTSNDYEMPASNKHSEPYVIRNTNYMQRQGTGVYYKYIRGMKTGSTPEAGYNLVSTATKDGETYMLIVMGTPYEKDENGYGLAFSVTYQLYEWAFSNLSVRPALDTTAPINEIKLKYCAEADSLLVYPSKDLLTVLPTESDESTLQKSFNLPQSVAAPIKKGDIIGTVTLSLAGEKIGTVELVSGQDFNRNTLLFVTGKLFELVNSLYFKVAVGISILAAAIYVFYASVQYKKHQNSRKVKRRRM